MKPLSSITIFLCSSSRRLFPRTTPLPFFNYEGETLVGVSHFSTSSPDSSSYHSSSRRNLEDVRNVRVSVWWDFENCHVPCNVNVYKVTQFITSAVRANGIKGPIQITAFGDVLQLSRSNQEALSSTGINLTHIPNGGKNSADRSLLVDLMYWVSQNPPPAHLFLISGDRDFASTLHRLRMNNYNILLASTDNAPAVLCSAASIMWQWASLVKGENLIGKHFNQPPDGPYASWYGHYRGPLEDPFAISSHVSNQSSCVQSEEVSDSNSDPKPRPIPMVVANVIRNILNSYPKGLPITELRSELGKSNITIEKDLYGHKKFSRFLMAMPSLLRLQSEKDGQFIVHGIIPKSRETCVPTPEMATGPVTVTKDSVPVVAHNETLSSSSKLNEATVSTEKQEEQLQVQEQPSVIEKVKEDEANHGQVYPINMNKPISEVGILSSFFRKQFKGNDGHQEKICNTKNVCSTSQNRTDTLHVDSKDQSADQGELSTSSSSTNEVMQDATIGQKFAENVDKATKPGGIFKQIVRWFKFWRSDKKSDDLNAELCKTDKEISRHSDMQEIVTESFWNALLAFLETSKGSASILQSKNRQEMAQNLQKCGPSQLQSLSETHILHLVDLLISDKKWVVENPSQTFPFRLVGPDKTFNSKESTKQNKDVTESNIKKKVSPRNRSQILSDCQKLVNEVVKEYPNGFNISSFKQTFLQKYGYHLEVQQLGYQKLATLLQIMPGMKLESNYILPSRGLCSNKSGVMEKDNDTEWEELGPIARINNNTKKDDDEFETLSDNDLSDSEEETSPTKHKKEEESSLLQILDTWYSNKEDSNNKNDFEEKQNPIKRYSFVADKPRDDKENLINGILGSLKKSGNGSPESKIEG